MRKTPYAIQSPYVLTSAAGVRILHDKPATRTRAEQIAQEIDDLFHLFLIKIASLPHQDALTPAEEARLIELFERINTLKRELEKA